MARTLTFGISRSHAGRDLDAGARRFADSLTARLGRKVIVTVTRDYEQLLEGLLVGGITIAWMAPLMHIRAAEEGALLACVSQRGGALTYRSALLVRSDSPCAGVASLRGMRAAWADPFSASGYLFPQLHLDRAGLGARDFPSAKFYGTSLRACQAVVDADADFCAHYVSDAVGPGNGAGRAGAIELSHALGDGVADKLRILDVTDPIPPDGVVLAPPVDGRMQAAMRDALLRLHESDEGKSALGALMQADRMMPVTGAVGKILARLRAEIRQRA